MSHFTKFCACWTLLVAGLGVNAQVVAQDAGAGRELYERYCMSCHGLNGKGDGPMRQVLNIPPADLTELSFGAGGEFPTHQVVARLSGSDPVLAHGSEMPVYGPVFEEGERVMLTGATQGVIFVRQPLADLIAYLREINAK